MIGRSETSTRRRWRWPGGAIALAIALAVAAAILLAWPREPAPHPETTWDTAPSGHAALFALLERFEATRGRWLTGLSMPPVDEPLWMIAPRGFCDPASDTGSGSSFRDLVQPWLEAGGEALVWLSRPPSPAASEDVVPWPAPAEGESRTIARRVDAADAAPGAEREEEEAIRERWREDLEAARRLLREGRAERCDAIGDFRLPPRRLRGLAAQGLEAGAAEGGHPLVRVGEDATGLTTRSLPGATLAFFEAGEVGAEGLEGGGFDDGALQGGAVAAHAGWRPLWVGREDRAPFALERTVGAGRLVVVADARVLTNGRLDEADAAPFVFDWVRATGPPWIDEHAHGVVPESSTLRYLLRSPAWAAMVGLLVLGLLVAWRGRAWPVRRVEEIDPAAPTLSAFVDSVARLYARSRDFDRIFERYRALSLERIRRALGLAPGTPAEIVVASLRARETGGSARRETGLGDLLTRHVRVTSVEELERATARLDALVEAIRLGSGRAGGDRPGTTRGAA
jgi:hypothetical protein